MSVETNKRIVKNTIFLYIRTFVSMLISLYTSRKILEALGISDFGIYNVVGGGNYHAYIFEWFNVGGYSAFLDC